MKNLCVFLLVCAMAVSAQAMLIDDFENFDMSNYTYTVILDLDPAGGSNTSVWQAPNGTLELNTSIFQSLEQSALVRNGLTLNVGQELQVDVVNPVSDSNSDYVGLYVGGTAPVAVGGAVSDTREDCVMVYINRNGGVSIGGRSGTEKIQNGQFGIVNKAADAATVGGATKLFIKNVNGADFQIGWYIDTIRVPYWMYTPHVTNSADYVGLYADARTVNVLGTLDNLTIYGTTLPSNPDIQEVAGTKVDAIFTWDAAVDAEGTYAMDPNIIRQDVYLSTTPDDPNLYYIGSDTTVDLNDAASQYPESGTYELEYGTLYTWTVVSIVDNASDQSVPALTDRLIDVADANNIAGPIWSHTTKTLDGEPDVVAGGTYLTWLDEIQAAPQVVTATVDDFGEGDMGLSGIEWTISAYPGDPSLINATLTDTSLDPLSPTATFTTDTAGEYEITITATETLLSLPDYFDSDTLTVYVAEDACAAAIYSGVTLNVYDELGNQNCVVDLADFAALASQWLDDVRLDGPVEY